VVEFDSPSFEKQTNRTDTNNINITHTFTKKKEMYKNYVYQKHVYTKKNIHIQFNTPVLAGKPAALEMTLGNDTNFPVRTYLYLAAKSS
jgi:hypothetical protein